MSEYGYDPDRDPLIQRARARAGGGASKLLIVVVVALVGWIVYIEFFRDAGGSGATSLKGRTPDGHRPARRAACRRRACAGCSC